MRKDLAYYQWAYRAHYTSVAAQLCNGQVIITGKDTRDGGTYVLATVPVEEYYW